MNGKAKRLNMRCNHLSSVWDQKTVAACAPDSAAKLRSVRLGVAGREQVGGNGGAVHRLNASVELKVLVCECRAVAIVGLLSARCASTVAAAAKHRLETWRNDQIGGAVTVAAIIAFARMREPNHVPNVIPFHRSVVVIKTWCKIDAVTRLAWPRV